MLRGENAKLVDLHLKLTQGVKGLSCMCISILWIFYCLIFLWQQNALLVFALLHKSSRDTLELKSAHLTRIAVDAPLGTAKRHVDDRGLPGHQIRQRRGVIFVHRGVVTEAPFAGPTSTAVLNSTSG